MPEVETIRRLVRAAAPILEDPLLTDDLPQWLGIKAEAGSRGSGDGTSAAVRAGVG